MEWNLSGVEPQDFDRWSSMRLCLSVEGIGGKLSRVISSDGLNGALSPVAKEMLSQKLYTSLKANSHWLK